MTNSMNITLPNDTLEGTVASLSTWLVKEGESVQQGDPILELETDKVTMEICAEASGVIAKILIAPGDSVGEDTVFGYLDCRRQEGRENNDQVVCESAIEVENCSDAISQRHLIGPAVRKLLREYDLNIEGIVGTGKGGRVTRNDITAFIHDHQTLKSNNAAPVQRPVNIATVSESVIKTGALNGKSIPHTSMRKSIANHMVESLLHTSPHVTSVFEMDMGRVIEHRRMCKMGFAEAGVKLTFTAYFLAAAAQAIRKVPLVNSRFYDDHLEVFDDINIGVGTALGDDGLVVPVIKQVQEKNLFGIATVLEQQTEKARNGKLTMSEMSDGTFTISNHGVGGSLFATPIIINQPQVAILGIGKLEKRVVVEEVNGEDVMVIRPKCYVSLSIDHRALDAYQTNLFLSHFVEVIENWGE
ncbi:2-oxo acid dehydrogenase subunit E2 [Marinomonas sp. TI.3.20]|uniref:dihydrolipoamide acetyltransferase family protein n=1 Tax=Marinomonas sp. TI.3.20 TaxID=3121296 RepID=UPI00311FA90F